MRGICSCATFTSFLIICNIYGIMLCKYHINILNISIVEVEFDKKLILFNELLDSKKDGKQGKFGAG